MSALDQTTSGAPSIDAETSLGVVSLRVADLDGTKAFYEHAMGLRALESTADTVLLGAGLGLGKPLVELVGRPGAPARERYTTGLFHLALLVPTRAELARALRRIGDAGWRLSGASDHLVSEALYLNDPEGNGIEIYRDRPREEWRNSGDQILMDTLPLDLGGLTHELPDGGKDAGMPMPDGTRIGHVHLNVADLAAAEAFYHGTLGFDVTTRGYPGALFVSAGGYHHHIGLNTWAGEGAPAPPPGTRGLRFFEVVLPHADELRRVTARLAAAGVGMERCSDGQVLVSDPSGNQLLLGA